MILSSVIVVVSFLAVVPSGDFYYTSYGTSSVDYDYYITYPTSEDGSFYIPCPGGRPSDHGECPYYVDGLYVQSADRFDKLIPEDQVIVDYCLGMTDVKAAEAKQLINYDPWKPLIEYSLAAQCFIRCFTTERGMLLNDKYNVDYPSQALILGSYPCDTWGANVCEAALAFYKCVISNTQHVRCTSPANTLGNYCTEPSDYTTIRRPPSISCPGNGIPVDNVCPPSIDGIYINSAERFDNMPADMISQCVSKTGVSNFEARSITNFDPAVGGEYSSEAECFIGCILAKKGVFVNNQFNLQYQSSVNLRDFCDIQDTYDCEAAFVFFKCYIKAITTIY